jgi:uncharacterized membrane protein YebE (DUF533 family)
MAPLFHGTQFLFGRRLSTPLGTSQLEMQSSANQSLQSQVSKQSQCVPTAARSSVSNSVMLSSEKKSPAVGQGIFTGGLTIEHGNEGLTSSTYRSYHDRRRRYCLWVFSYGLRA